MDNIEEKLELAESLARDLEKRGLADRSPELLHTAWVMMDLVDYIAEQENLDIGGNGD